MGKEITASQAETQAITLAIALEISQTRKYHTLAGMMAKPVNVHRDKGSE